MNKHIITGIAVLAVYYLCIWLFNHINAWIGITGTIITTIVLINYINKLITSEQKKNEKKF